MDRRADRRRPLAADPVGDDEELDVVRGRAEPAVDEDDHLPHAFLYVPDLSSVTGWSAHRVPVDELPARRRVGFVRD